MRSSIPAWNSKSQSGTEVTGVDLISGMDLSRGRGRRMEHDHDGRRESGSELAST
jgi:hypothetical protein